MSAVNNNAFTNGFPVMSAATPEFGSAGQGTVVPQTSRARDSIGQIAVPILPSPGDGTGDGGGAWSGGWNSGSDSGLAGFNAIMNGFVNALQTMLAGIGRQFGLTSGSAGTATSPQTYFTSATGSSVGDPHETFDGTPTSGPSVDRKWDSMQSHANLLNSDSFDGGYTVSTTVTSPDGKGVTTNAQAQVALDGGATKITMNEDGSYSVSEHGRQITLERDRTESLGNGESVTLNADSSLSVSAETGSGGSLVTTLKAAGGGVDVHDTAANVDLGGYLVTHDDDAGIMPEYDAVSRAPIVYAFDASTDNESTESRLRTA